MSGLTATIALDKSTALINQQINAVVTITSTLSAAVNVVGVTPTAIFTGSSVPNFPGCALGQVPLGPGETIAIGASGTLALPFSVVFFAPSTGPLGAGAGTMSIGAVIQTSDGQIFKPTAATATVNPISLPSSEQ